MRRWEGRTLDAPINAQQAPPHLRVAVALDVRVQVLADGGAQRRVAGVTCGVTGISNRAGPQSPPAGRFRAVGVAARYALPSRLPARMNVRQRCRDPCGFGKYHGGDSHAPAETPMTTASTLSAAEFAGSIGNSGRNDK